MTRAWTNSWPGRDLDNMAEDRDESSLAEMQLHQPENPMRQASGSAGTDIDYQQIAQAVALLLKPVMKEAVKTALQQSLQHIEKEMATGSKHIDEKEQRIVTVEKEMQEGQAATQNLERNYQLMAVKLNNLENRSRRNNLRIVGLPESSKVSDLQ